MRTLAINYILLTLSINLAILAAILPCLIIERGGGGGGWSNKEREGGGVVNTNFLKWEGAQ